MTKLIGKCPHCGNDRVQVRWIGTCAQHVLHWENDNPAWAINPAYGELSEWDMEWDVFFCLECDEEFSYNDIVFEEEA